MLLLGIARSRRVKRGAHYFGAMNKQSKRVKGDGDGLGLGVMPSVWCVQYSSFPVKT